MNKQQSMIEWGELRADRDRGGYAALTDALAEVRKKSFIAGDLRVIEVSSVAKILSKYFK